MICPECGHDFEPSRTVQSVTICPQCLASLALATETQPAVRATSAHTVPLTPDELTSLKALRKELRAEKELTP